MKMLTCFLILIFGSLAWADNLYVKSKYADLQKHPQKKNGKKRVNRGEALVKVRKVKSWYNVKYNGKKWWVYKGKLSSRPPKKDSSLLSANYADDVAAGSAVRGLSKVALKYAKSQNVKEKHEQFMDYHQSFITSEKENLAAEITSRGVRPEQITTEMLEKFQADGKIGVYASSGDESEFETEQ